MDRDLRINSVLCLPDSIWLHRPKKAVLVLGKVSNNTFSFWMKKKLE